MNMIEKVKVIDQEVISFLNLDSNQFFSPLDWKKYFDFNFIEEINLEFPIKIEKLKTILESQCPFIPDKKIKETHYFFYLPQKINNEPLTIEKWQKMFSKGSQPCFCSYLTTNAWYKEYDFAIKDVTRFSWLLMFKGITPNSVNKNLKQQLITKPHHYEVPKLVECLPLHFLIFKKNKGQRINENIWGRTYDTDNVGDHVITGFFDICGISIFNHVDFYSNSDLGSFFFRKLI